MPFVVVELRVVGAVLIARPPGLLPEERMPRHSLGSENPVAQFPIPLQLMRISGTHMLEVLRNMPKSSGDWFSSGSW